MPGAVLGRAPRFAPHYAPLFVLRPAPRSAQCVRLDSRPGPLVRRLCAGDGSIGMRDDEYCRNNHGEQGRNGAMRILALDSASAACSVAVLSDGVVCARAFEARLRGHAERLVPMIEAVVGESGIAFDQFDAVAVTVGPGAFTGVRIGLATARGLALATGAPLIGVTTLEAVAAAVPEELRAGRDLAVVLDARKGEVYLQRFSASLAPLDAPCNLPPAAVPGLLGNGPVLVVGAGQSLVEPYIGDCPLVSLAPDGGTGEETMGLPDAIWVARLAAARGLPEAGAPMPEPLYIRPPDAQIPADLR